MDKETEELAEWMTQTAAGFESAERILQRREAWRRFNTRFGLTVCAIVVIGLFAVPLLLY
jgi:hypothetical protein